MAWLERLGGSEVAIWETWEGSEMASQERWESSKVGGFLFCLSVGDAG